MKFIELLVIFSKKNLRPEKTFCVLLGPKSLFSLKQQSSESINFTFYLEESRQNWFGTARIFNYKEISKRNKILNKVQAGVWTQDLVINYHYEVPPVLKLHI